MKTLLTILFALSFSNFANAVEPGCPIDQQDLVEAVQNGQQIVCQIEYFQGRSGNLKKVPLDPQPKPTIEAACEDAVNRGCQLITTCIASDYYECSVAN